MYIYVPNQLNTPHFYLAMMSKRGPRKLKTVAKSVIRFSLAIVVMDIADCIPVEVVLAHMVEGEKAEGHVEAEEAVVLIEAVATVLLVTSPLLKIKKTAKEGRFSEQRQNLEDNEVSLQFEAGRLKYYSHEWEKIIAGSNLLDIVKDCHIEFIDNIKPCQTKAPFQNIFNEKENEIIDKEIQNLLEIGAIKKAQNKKPIFLSTIFARPKKNGELKSNS